VTILDKIIANKQKEVTFLAGVTAVRDLERSSFFKRDTISLSGFLSDSNKTGIIAEFKRKSRQRA